MDNMITTPENVDIGAGEVEIKSRQIAEMQSKIFLAKQFPRNLEDSRNRILQACQNPRLAESATFSYPRGGETIKGGSIRLAEMIAQNFGNFMCGVSELQQKDGESTVKAFAWDVETNFSDEKIFTVKHERKSGKFTKKLTDSRDIYEIVANQAARRKRACIFAVIPKYIVDEAVEACERTQEQHIRGHKSIEDVREDVFAAFYKLSPKVTKDNLATVVGREYGQMDYPDILRLKRLYTAIREGFVKIENALNLGGEQPPEEMSKEERESLDALNKDLGAVKGGNQQG